MGVASSGMPTASANGKVILFGEYAVLSGIAGYAVALKDFSLSITLPNTTDSAPYDMKQLLGMATLESNIPQGSGLGSSAALSVALARAILLDKSASNDPNNVFILAKGFEDEIHGGSSGIDTFTVISGGLCSMSETNKFTKLPGILLERLKRFKLSLINTNSSRNVHQIKATIIKIDLDEYLPVAQEISRTFQTKLKADQLTLPLMIDLFNRSQEALVKLKVSTPLIDSITKRLPMAGVKITGAGGGGCLLVVHDENVPESLLKEILVNDNITLYYDISF